ncbi:MAG: MFS transporter [Microbacterium sp.]|nr:MFS transporter [Microbacterium sp.]
MNSARARWTALSVLCIGTLMTVLDETIVNVALPVMQRELGFTQAGVSWVINAYLLAYGGLLIFAGRLGDLIGHRRVLLIGVSVFTVASVSAGLSSNATMLVISRFAQGGGAAMITAVTLALIVTMFTDQREQTRAIGFYSFTFAGGGALGLLVGGVLMQLTSWQWLFFINLPIGLLSLVVGWRLLPRGRGPGLTAGLDILGAGLLVSAVSLLVYGVITAEHLGWGGQTLVDLGVAVVLLIVAIVWAITQRADEPDPDAGQRQPTVRTDSHVLDEGGPGAVTVVEFLDFECEACGAFYPIVEELRDTYDGDIRYVARYFPLPGHVNSTQAALAAEAAAQQGRFEDMYHHLFATQANWGEQPEETPEVFRAFAQELGLDLAAYDEAVADPATLARVEQDKRDGERLGVTSTPTFFVDGEMLELTAWGDLEDAIAKAVAD